MSRTTSRNRPNFDPTVSGIAGNQLIMTDAIFRCGDELHDDIRYAANVQRLRRLAAPSINRNLASWKMRRDGFMEGFPIEEPCTACGGTGHELRDPRWVPGFWLNEDSEPIEPGSNVPKEAWMGMEGAVMEVLHLDGIYWYKDKTSSKTRDIFLDLVKSDPKGDGDEEE